MGRKKGREKKYSTTYCKPIPRRNSIRSESEDTTWAVLVGGWQAYLPSSESKQALGVVEIWGASVLYMLSFC